MKKKTRQTEPRRLISEPSSQSDGGSARLHQIHLSFFGTELVPASLWDDLYPTVSDIEKIEVSYLFEIPHFPPIEYCETEPLSDWRPSYSSTPPPAWIDQSASSLHCEDLPRLVIGRLCSETQQAL